MNLTPRTDLPAVLFHRTHYGGTVETLEWGPEGFTYSFGGTPVTLTERQSWEVLRLLRGGENGNPG